MTGFALVQGGIQVLQLGRQKIPVIERLLKLAGDARRIMRGAQVARNHHQLTIA